MVSNLRKNAKFFLALFATVLSVAALVLWDFPQDMVATFGFGHGDAAHPIRSLWGEATGDAYSRTLFASGAAGFVVGLVLIAAAPMLAAALLLLTPDEPRERAGSLLVTVVAYLAYFFYYIGTYHAPLLVLAVLAWVLATQHVREISAVNAETAAQKEVLGHVDQVVESSQKLANTNTALLQVLEQNVKNLEDTTGALRQMSIHRFYKEFGPKVEAATKTIVSVERRWTWQKRSWARIPEDQCNPDAESLESTIGAIEDCDLHKALVATGASRCLYIGPWPTRASKTGYAEEAFGQLLALIHTMCVCEVAKYTRKKKRKGPIRLHVAVADVPTWVKIVDSDYWLLQGESRQPVHVTQCEKETAGGQAARRHASRLAAQWEIVETYNRNARRGHEHVLALILEHATILNAGNLMQETAVNNLVWHDLDKIVRSIKGGPHVDDPFKDYLSRGNVLMKPRHIVHLFRLFLALHFLKEKDQLTGKYLSNSLTSLSYSSIWNRIA